MDFNRIIVFTTNNTVNLDETCPRCGGGMHSSRSVCYFCEQELYRDGCCEGYDGSGESFEDLFMF